MKSCDAGETHACGQAAQLLTTLEPPTNLVAARTLYDRACTGGSHQSFANLGQMLYDGEGGPVDLERANELMTRASQGGVQTACVMVGR